MSEDHITKDELFNRFSAVDYVVFATMLVLSAAIGVFYGCFGNKVKDTKEFLLAGKSMGTFPVAMSLIASFMSAITLLGTPSEVYANGFSYSLIGLSYLTVMPATAYLYLPVFWDLQLTSAYEYLHIRFNKSVRMLGSGIFILQMSLYMAVVVYAPALALSQVTGINVYLSVSVICFVCIFYTTIGGMKAVLWTDALQVVIMYITTLYIIIDGAVEEGGFNAVWEAATRGNRTEIFDWDLNPTTRHTFWSLLIGGYFTWIAVYGCNQAQVQRYLCVREKYMATNALWINMVGLVVLMVTCAFGGLVLYKRYETCDPIKSGFITTVDQLLPLYVMEALGQYKGLPGLFVAGIFSGALSTVSSGMNSLAAITLEDFVKGSFYPDISERTATFLSKVLSLFYGVLTFGLVFVAERLGNILAAALSIFGLVGGPLLGVFTLGMFFPWANSIGAFFGTLIGLAFTFWIGVGCQVAVATGKIVVDVLPLHTHGCTQYNSTNDALEQEVYPHVEVGTGIIYSLYKVSYLWYSAIGCLTVIITGMLISLLTGLNDPKKINPKTLSPLIYWIKDILPEGDLIGSEYVDVQEICIDPDAHVETFGQTNLAFYEQSPPTGKDGHIEHIEAFSRL